MTNPGVLAAASEPGPAERAVLDGLVRDYAVVPRTAGGVLLRTLVSAAAREPGARPILLLHGRGHAATMWASWLRAWSSRAVVAVDLPGFGHSGTPELPLRPTPETGLGYFSEPVGRLAAELDPCAIVGHSLGGFVALETVRRRHVEPAALVLVDAMGLGPVVLPAARLYLRAGPERLARWGLGRLGPSASARDELGALRAELAQLHGGRLATKRAFDAMLPLFGEPLHRRAQLGSIDVPTLLVWGERDEAFPLATALDAVTRMPHARLVRLPAGHSPHFELAGRTRAEVERFVDAQTAAARVAPSSA